MGNQADAGRGKRETKLADYEIYNSPSALARRVWLYARAAGHALQPASFFHRHQDHDGYILHFLIRGELWHSIHDRRYLIRRREACLFDLKGSITYGNAGQTPVEFDWVWFNGKDLPILFQELRVDLNPVFTRLDLPRIRSLFRELIARFSRPSVVNEVRMSASLTLLLAELLASRTGASDTTPLTRKVQPVSDAVKKALNLIALSYENPLTVKQIAAVVGQSLSHFSRLFREEVGLPPIVFLNQYRIERARELLTVSKASIAEIGRQVGLRNQNYFARLFRKVTGTSPIHYRQQQAQEPPSR
jgi:AraC-like DNA-binding protein